MSPIKRFLLIYIAVYAVLAAAGILLFRSPDYSREYLNRYQADHARFLEITANPAFEPFAERPHLYPQDDPRREQLAFVRQYKARPEYRGERLRIEAFSLYFHVLNGVMFLMLVVRVGYQPALAYLDKRIARTKAQMEQAAQDRVSAMHRLAESVAEAEEWEGTQSEMARRADAAINASLTQIREEARLADIQLARETEDRKRAEIYRAAVLIKKELVSQAVETLQARYSAESSESELADKVDQFVRLLDLIA